MSDNSTTGRPASACALTDFTVSEDPNDGSVTLQWSIGGEILWLVAFTDGKLVRVGPPHLPSVTTHVEALVNAV